MKRKDDNTRDHQALRFDMAKRYAYNDILDGSVASVMIKKFMNDEYGLGYKYSKAQAERAVYAARQMIKDDFKEQMASLREDTYSRLLDVYTDSREQNDRGNALKALDQIAKLTGLNETKINVEGKIDSNVVIDFGFKNNEENGE